MDCDNPKSLTPDLGLLHLPPSSCSHIFADTIGGASFTVSMGWDGKDFRLRINFKSYWDIIRSNPHSPALVEAIRSVGLFSVFQIGMMTHDAGLISSFVERWRPETHTFHFSFGEATITLEDVYYILGLPISGLLVFTEEGLPDASLVH